MFEKKRDNPMQSTKSARLPAASLADRKLGRMDLPGVVRFKRAKKRVFESMKCQYKEN